jgi:hypothetical protein
MQDFILKLTIVYCSKKITIKKQRKYVNLKQISI